MERTPGGEGSAGVSQQRHGTGGHKKNALRYSGQTARRQADWGGCGKRSSPRTDNDVGINYAG